MTMESLIRLGRVTFEEVTQRIVILLVYVAVGPLKRLGRESLERWTQRVIVFLMDPGSSKRLGRDTWK
jgi:hypothetical protein